MIYVFYYYICVCVVIVYNIFKLTLIGSTYKNYIVNTYNLILKKLKTCTLYINF